MSQYYFTSARLGFRSWKPEDLEPFATLCADPEVMEFFPSVLTRGQTAAFIERINSHFAEHGYGWFAVELLEAKEFIGFIGIGHPRFESFFTPCFEIGWRLAKEYWNSGYATEGALACLDYAFNKLEATEVYSFTAKTNLKSEYIMQKIGMEKAGEFEHPMLEEGSPLRLHVVYKCSASQ